VETPFTSKLNGRTVSVSLSGIIDVPSYTVVTPPPTTTPISTFNLGGLSADGHIESNGVDAVLEISLGGTPFSTAFSVTSTQLDNKNIAVTIKGTGDIPLSYVHYLRQALVTAGASAVTINVGTGVTPSFKGEEWLNDDNQGILLGPGNLSGYTLNQEDNLMTGVTIKDVSGKRYIEYNTDLMINGNLPYNDLSTSFYGFGIKAKSGSTAQLSSDNWSNIRIGGLNGYTNQGHVSDWGTYLTDLKESGLSRVQNPNGFARDLSTAPYPTHNISVGWGSTNTNIMQNGVYDFVLAHYNPKAADGVDGDDRSSSINNIGWPTGTFDGKNAPPSGFPARKVNLTGAIVTLSSLARKAPNGNINNMFYGSLNTAMARYLQTKVGISEFKNANIYGGAN
jgi:hypothetical protein